VPLAHRGVVTLLHLGELPRETLALPHPGLVARPKRHECPLGLLALLPEPPVLALQGVVAGPERRQRSLDLRAFASEPAVLPRQRLVARPERRQRSARLLVLVTETFIARSAGWPAPKPTP
jgi:hypothetical protein